MNIALRILRDAGEVASSQSDKSSAESAKVQRAVRSTERRAKRSELFFSAWDFIPMSLHPLSRHFL